MRPNMPKSIRVKIYPKLKEIYPEICSYCQKTINELNINPFDEKTGRGGLELHHTRYDVSLDDYRFIRFMCHGCNHKKELSFSELERYNNDLSASHLANIDKAQIFLEWFSNEMIENNYRMSKDEVINGGAYVSGLNVVTIGRLLKPLTEHKNSPFSRAHIDGIDTIFLRGRGFERPDYKDINKFNEDAEKFK